MPTLYDNSFGPGIPLGSSLVPGSATQGALNANLLTGGFLTVPSLADRDAIPVDFAEGLKLDGLSSGRRQVGMVVTVAETGERFELKIANFSALSTGDKLVALGDNTNWVVFTTSGATPTYSEDDDAVYCFQVGVSYNPSHFHLAKLSVTQLRRLIYDSDLYYTGYSQVSIVTDEAAGHRHTVVLTYNPAQHALEVVRVENEDGAEQVNHSAYPILADADVARRTGGNTFTGEQAINGGSSYGTYSSSRVRLQGPNSTQFEVTPTYLEFQGGVNLVAGRIDATYDTQAGAGTLKVTTGHFKVPMPRQADDAATKQYVDQTLSSAGSGSGVTKQYVDSADQTLQAQFANVLHLNGDETINGNKTFTNPLTVVGDTDGNGITAPLIVRAAGNTRIGTTIILDASNVGGKKYTFGSIGDGVGASSGCFVVYNFTNNVYCLKLSSDGSAAFSGNVTAPKFIGDGSLLTNLPAAGARIANSAIFTATTTGAQVIDMGIAATGLISVTLLEAGSTTYTRLVWEGFCTINGTNLSITADPQIQSNDKIFIKYTF